MLTLLKVFRWLVQTVMRYCPDCPSFLFSIYWNVNREISHIEKPPNPDYLDFMNAYLEGYVFATVDRFIAEKKESLSCSVSPKQIMDFRAAVEQLKLDFELIGNQKEYAGKDLWNIWNDLYPETLAYRKEIKFLNMWYDKYR